MSCRGTYAEIRMMIRIGSLAMVTANMENAGPNAIKAQPTNSEKVMVGEGLVRQGMPKVVQSESVFIRLTFELMII